MANESVFAQDWREALQAHYKHVVRNNDQITLKTLVGVLHDVGFTDDDLRQLAFEATLRTEDVADDFVPDMEIMSGAQPVAKPDVSAPEVVPPEEVSSDDVGLTLEDSLAVVESVLAEEAALDETPAEVDAEIAEATSDSSALDDDDHDEAGDPPKEVPGIQQLSLF